MGVEKDQTDLYRVFVPYNTLMPQVILKLTNPQAMENKRIIVRIKKWLI